MLAHLKTMFTLSCRLWGGRHWFDRPVFMRSACEMGIYFEWSTHWYSDSLPEPCTLHNLQMGRSRLNFKFKLCWSRPEVKLATLWTVTIQQIPKPLLGSLISQITLLVPSTSSSLESRGTETTENPSNDSVSPQITQARGYKKMHGTHKYICHPSKLQWYP